METITHTIEINASAGKIWEILWKPECYAEWTKFFGSEGGRMESDLKIDGRTLFLDQTGENGMISTIESLDAPCELVFKHLGNLKNGDAITESRQIEEWSAAQEKYFLTELDGYTKLQGIVHTSHEHADQMKEGFEKGFSLVKELAER